MSAFAEVIGDPIAHSLSPDIHSHWIEQSALEANYQATRVTMKGLQAFLQKRQVDPDWRGCNVAMPLKCAAMDYVDHVDPVSRRIGALNTIVRDEKSLLGLNTDWKAIHLLLDMERLRPERVIIVGTGGAARSALEEMRQAGVEEVALISRSPRHARVLLAEFGLRGEVIGPGAAPVADLLINASPLGMTGYPPLELDLSRMANGGTVFDMVYSPADTDLLKAARQRGLRTIDGLSMLIQQAALAFAHFFERTPVFSDGAELRGKLTS